MKGLAPVIGHEDIRHALGTAAHTGSLTNALLLHGPPGIGKQRVALWLAQLLVCEEQGATPCDRCLPCRLARQLEHPDVHWFFPLPRPKVSGGSDKLGEALEDLRAEELVSRRSDPLYPTGTNETTGIYLAHVQIIRRMAAARPAMGSRKVFVIGDAEALVPQEASPEAANALLKVLEEPPADTTVILTAADPEVLLPTVRSRLLPVRMRPLAEQAVADFLVQHRDLPPASAAVIARLAQGSIGRGLAYAPDGEDPGPLEVLRASARSLLEIALEGAPAARLQAAHAQAPAGARGAFAGVLEQLSLWLRDLGAAATGADDLIVNADARDWLRSRADRLPGAGVGVPEALRAIDEAMKLIQFNINPQLAMNALLRKVAAALRPAATPTAR
jgi:DNA polymerase-3 subunit delta'